VGLWFLEFADQVMSKNAEQGFENMPSHLVCSLLALVALV
jgi:hypothetical protein